MARYPRRRVVTAVLATTLASGAAGAAVNHALTSGSRTPVTASQAAVSVSQSTRLGVSEIYRRNSAAVVEVDVTTDADRSAMPFGGGGI